MQIHLVVFDIGSLLSNTILAIVCIFALAYTIHTWLKYKRLYLDYFNKKKKKEVEKNGRKESLGYTR